MKTLYLVLMFIAVINLRLSAQLTAKDYFDTSIFSIKNPDANINSILKNSDMDIVFIENLGQIRDTEGKHRSDILFFARSQGVDVYITNKGINYVF